MDRETCREMLGSFSAYLDGEAEAEVCRAIEAHLASCSDCRVVVDSLRRTVSLVHDVPRPSLSPEARQRLYKVLNLSDYLQEPLP